jgi:hypothetical protein
MYKTSLGIAHGYSDMDVCVLYLSEYGWPTFLDGINFLLQHKSFGNKFFAWRLIVIIGAYPNLTCYVGSPLGQA